MSPIGTTHPVLDKGFVELLDFMPHPATGVSGDLAIVNAARVSFMGESKGEAADKKLLFYLLRHKHTSPFEQVQFKFRVKAPVLVFWQWVRHRTFTFMSINSQSGRYTEFGEDEFYTPSVWRIQSKSNKQGSDGEMDESAAYVLSAMQEKLHELAFAYYQVALQQGVAREQARLFLPGFGVYYTWVMSVNALNLMNFFQLRRAEDAQWEIRQYADAMYEHFFKPALPWTAEIFEELSR